MMESPSLVIVDFSYYVSLKGNHLSLSATVYIYIYIHISLLALQALLPDSQ